MAQYIRICQGAAKRRLPTIGKQGLCSWNGRKRVVRLIKVCVALLPGGSQMDGFIDLFMELIINAGIAEHYVFRKRSVELPGYFRPTKKWDLLVVRDQMLIAAIELKSQVGPSFGNNFNNRTEEAMGSALDLWTAYREHAYLDSPQPFL